jgi:hypothetical protein
MNKTILNKIKTEPMSDTDIKKYLPADQNIIEYNALSDIKTIEDLLPTPNSYKILLYAQRDNDGHWTCIKRMDNDIYYFDSYGNRIDYPLNWSKDMNSELGQSKSYLSNLLNKCKYNIKTKHPKILTGILIYSFTTRIKKKYKLK